VTVPYQIAEAIAIIAAARSGGTRSAPAKGGTIARMPGRKRLMKIANRPYLPYIFWSLSVISLPPRRAMRASSQSAPKCRPTAYMIIAPDTFPIHVERNAPSAVPCPRAARKLPKATTVSAGTGGKMFSIAAMTPSET
jgi:hypothetical protein